MVKKKKIETIEEFLARRGGTIGNILKGMYEELITLSNRRFVFLNRISQLPGVKREDILYYDKRTVLNAEVRDGFLWKAYLKGTTRSSYSINDLDLPPVKEVAKELGFMRGKFFTPPCFVDQYGNVVKDLYL